MPAGDIFIDVVAAAILSKDQTKVLLSLRHESQHQGGLWEFPGGKVEDREDLVTALTRELNEELGIDVKTSKSLTTIEHRYIDKAVRLHVFTVYDFEGRPYGKEQQTLRWTLLTELEATPFPDANKPIVAELLAALSGDRPAQTALDSN